MATFILRRDSKNQYYWILKSDKNGKTIAMSSEAYIDKRDAEYSVAWTQANAKSASKEDRS